MGAIFHYGFNFICNNGCGNEIGARINCIMHCFRISFAGWRSIRVLYFQCGRVSGIGTLYQNREGLS